MVFEWQGCFVGFDLFSLLFSCFVVVECRFCCWYLIARSSFPRSFCRLYSTSCSSLTCDRLEGEKRDSGHNSLK